MTQDELSTLLDIPPIHRELEINSVTEDSRKVHPCSLFIARAGQKSDGHSYMEQAVANGAAAVLGNRKDIADAFGKPYIFYEHPRRAAGLIAHALEGNPSENLCVIGVTGTNGKTSTCCLIQQILNHSGFLCANFGTLGYSLPEEEVPAAHTTPFGEDLAQLFSRAKQQGCTHVVMEVSSHALEQERVAGIHFNIGAFTNLTQDHLDYHQSMDAYLEAKLLLFHKLHAVFQDPQGARPCFSAVNREDPSAARFIEAFPEACISYGKGGTIHAKEVVLDIHGAQFTLVTPEGSAAVTLSLVGRHNVQNALCAAAICHGAGIPLKAIAAGLASLTSIPGRMEAVGEGFPFQVVVDYAHTDDGLRNALNAARAVCKRKVIVVFGCGGDRDKSKRPKMGAVAAELADLAIITSDNPRTEDPFLILLDVEIGLQKRQKYKGDDYLVIESRQEAIEKAVSMAAPGDLILIAGKGHEDYQIIGTERRHFDDREAARAALKVLSL
jgi:UDP-N-acetylmuramoyl-L-alanyl-D-glutamate--2,6-diaminopimelate ligase